MADVKPYKQYTRNQRRAVLETDFSKGMMSTNGLVDEGYMKTLVNFTYEKDNGSLIPRPALRPYQLIMPDTDLYDDPLDDSFFSDSVTIKDVKECVEDGKSYWQIIIGSTNEDDSNSGRLAIITAEKTDAVSLITLDDDYTFDLRYSGSHCVIVDEEVCFYSSDIPQIHNVFLSEDNLHRMEFPVGSFAFGNSYYFFVKDGADNSLCRTYFSDNKYTYEVVTPKSPSVSEAVTYGYNMLRGDDAYTFSDRHAASVMTFDGILPYDPGTNTLLMSPRKNQNVLFRAYYDVVDGREFDIVWEWRETTSADWTPIQKQKWTSSSSAVIECTFQPPAADMMIRVSAYPYIDDLGQPSTEPNVTVEKAMVVGFDFSLENFGTANTLEQKVYDMSTATGMEVWNGRIVLWGLPADPTILFISDYNEPAYFPYPNNITVFDEPIIYALEFMDTLAVFTTNKIYQVTLGDDGNSWKSTVLQSHLSINAWDKHLIQTVRNMLYFKSGNYYYMMVPKAQSLTGELTLAPITTPITSFFDNFSVNVQDILEEAYDFRGTLDLVSYYNYLDYEDIHNVYLYRFDDSDSLLHFDVIYNTVDRTWKVWTYESAQSLYPFKHNATETGLLANTSLISAYVAGHSTFQPMRIVQVFTWDKNLIRGAYLPDYTRLMYEPGGLNIYADGTTVYFPYSMASVDSHGAVVIGDAYADADGSKVILLGSGSFFNKFSISDVTDALKNVYDNSDDYFTFRNYQFIDTGYRKDELQAKKRYRELQLLIDNLDKKNMQFGMEYLIDGAPRRLFYKYEVTQIIDELDPEYGIIYIESTPYFEVELDNIDLTNQWILDQNLYPEISFWKVRVAVSGKGIAPKLKLFSRNEKRFGLLSVNWVSRLMNMR